MFTATPPTFHRDNKMRKNKSSMCERCRREGNGLHDLELHHDYLLCLICGSQLDKLVEKFFRVGDHELDRMLR